MPLTASILRSLSQRFSRRGIYDVSDSFAIAAACSARGDIFGREVWIDSAIEKMALYGIRVPLIVRSFALRDLAA